MGLISRVSSRTYRKTCIKHVRLVVSRWHQLLEVLFSHFQSRPERPQGRRRFESCQPPRIDEHHRLLCQEVSKKKQDQRTEKKISQFYSGMTTPRDGSPSQTIFYQQRT